MDARDMMEMNEQLEKIRASVDALRQGDLSRSAASGALEAQLVRIWDISADLQRHIIRPVVLDGYRQDALEQIGRVNELLYDLGNKPDDRQLIGFGLACDLVQQKVNTWQRMANFAACTEIITGLAASEVTA